ncbi:MAG: glycosyltransferase family 4 protein [Nanoarchaeota archaeon]
MKILFVSEYFPPKVMGGGEINLELLVQNLSKNGIKVYVLTSHFTGLKEYEKICGVHIYRRLKTGKNADSITGNFFRSYFFPKSVKKEIIKLKKKIDFDIVHFIGTSIIAAELCNKLKLKCVATIESYITLCPKGNLIYKGEKICSQDCNFCKFVSCQLKSEEIGKIRNRFYLKYCPFFLIYIYNHYRKLNKSLKKCSLISISSFIEKRLGFESNVIPNIIEVDKFYYKKPKNKKINILYLGSLTRYKGPQILLKAAKGLDCKIKLYGDGILKKHLVDIIKKYDMDAKIYSQVDYKKVPKIFAESDIVVFPSIWPEPFGRIAVEAMASGKPIIASDAGAIKDIIKDSGIVVKAGDVNDLRKAINRLMKNKKLRFELGKKGMELVNKYSKENVIKKLIEFYKIKTL